MRTYKRTFDWDEAKRLHDQGLTYQKIADQFGVTPSAIFFACRPEAYTKALARTSAYQKGGTCLDCGAPISRNRSRPTSRCRRCAARHQPTFSARPTELRCSACQKWLPDNAFPRDRSEPHRRGRHSECTPCGTKRKAAYRARHQDQQRAYDKAYKHARYHNLPWPPPTSAPQE